MKEGNVSPISWRVCLFFYLRGGGESLHIGAGET